MLSLQICSFCTHTSAVKFLEKNIQKKKKNKENNKKKHKDGLFLDIIVQKRAVCLLFIVFLGFLFYTVEISVLG